MTSIVSGNSRIRHPDLFTIGAHSIVDDYCYFSTTVIIGKCSHIASGCTIAGGRERIFTMGDFSSVSAGVRIWCTSDDFVNDVVAILPPGAPPVKQGLLSGDVTLGNYTAVGSNSVIMPGVAVPEGTTVGALSFVPFGSALEPWSVYAGVPVKRIGDRNRDRVLEQVSRLEGHLDG